MPQVNSESEPLGYLSKFVKRCENMHIKVFLYISIEHYFPRTFFNVLQDLFIITVRARNLENVKGICSSILKYGKWPHRFGRTCYGAVYGIMSAAHSVCLSTGILVSRITK